jgi:hypothetical protein
MEELDNHLIHPCDTNIDTIKEQQKLHAGKNTLEVLLHAQHFYCLNDSAVIIAELLL